MATRTSVVMAFAVLAAGCSDSGSPSISEGISMGGPGTPTNAGSVTGSINGAAPGSSGGVLLPSDGIGTSGPIGSAGAGPSGEPQLTPRGDGTYMDAAGNITTGDGTVLFSNNGNDTYSAADGTVVVVNDNGMVTTQDGQVLADTDDDGIPDLADDLIGMAVDPNRPEIQANESEDDSTFLAPVTTGDVIWSANPSSGRVALIDAVTRDVRTVTAGLLPTYLAAIPGDDERRRTAVINVGNDTATLFDEQNDGTLSDLTVELQDDANAWTISRGGRFAIAWSSHRRVTRELANAEGLQDVTVLDLSEDPPTVTRLAVGYRPVKLEITDDETRAFAVTGQGITPIELGRSSRSADDLAIRLPEGVELAGYAPEDVAITGDGRYALVRHAGTNVVSVLVLESGEQVDLEFASDVTDLDLSSDGTSGIVVLRQTSEVVVFELDEVVEDPTALTVVGFGSEVVGSAVVAEEGDTAVLFTNAVENDRVSVLNLGGDEITKRSVSLRVPVRSVFVAPDASHAIAFLAPPAGTQPPGAFAIVPLGSNLPPKIVAADGVPTAVAIADTENGVRGLVTVRDEAAQVYQVHLIRMPSLQTDVIELPAPPIATGILSSQNLGYVAQAHAEGLITFIDLDTGETQTLTGFELAARVVDGSGK